MATQPKNTTTTTTPPSWMIPYIKEGLGEAKNYLNGPTPQFYQGELNPDFSQATQNALALKQQGVQSDPSVVNNANSFISKTLGGDFLNNNPGLDNVLQRTQQSTIDNFNSVVAPSRDSSFIRSGRYGSGLHQRAMADSHKILAQQLGDNASNLLFNNYNNAAQRQISALGIAPGLLGQQANQAGANIGLASEAGNAYDLLNRARASTAQQAYDYNQDAQYSQLARYMGLINGTNAGSSTTKPVYTNPFAQALGLAGLVAAPFTGGASLFGSAAGFGGGSALGGLGSLTSFI